MSDKKHRDDRSTSSPPVGSVQQRALTEGAEMLEASSVDAPLETAQALQAVPVGEFEDLKSNPIAMDFTTLQALEKYRIKSAAQDSRASLVLINRLVDIVEKQTDETIEKKRWTRQKWGEVLAVFTSGGLLVAIISALLHYFLGSP